MYTTTASVGRSAAASVGRREPTELDALAVIDHLALGGAEMMLGQFAAAAPRAGIRLHVACLEEGDGNPAAESLRAVGVEPVNLEVNGRPGRRHVQAVRSHIRALAPDIVHTHLGTSDLVGGIAARSLGVPAVSTIHAVTHRRAGLPGAKLALADLSRRLCDARVIAVSESARRAYIEHGRSRSERVVCIYNGIDVAALPGSGRQVRRELGVGDGELLVGMVSALRPEKGQDIAIDAIARLLERIPQLRLLIVGRGQIRWGEELKRLAAPLGDRVLMTGRRTDVMNVFDALDVCLHPSRIDAFPTTLIEALAASVPVLATAVGGIPEIIEDGRTGVLLPAPASAVSVARSLGELLENPHRGELAAAGREAYEQRFTAGPWVERTRALYDTVLSESVGRRNRAGRVDREPLSEASVS